MILPPGEPPPPGFHYVCTRCGACCRWEGYVRLSEEEVEAIAAFLGLAVEQFVARYTVLTEDRQSLSLIERGDGACVMLDGDDRCRIQSVKPHQCQAFPNVWNFPGWEDLCRARMVPDDEEAPPCV